MIRTILWIDDDADRDQALAQELAAVGLRVLVSVDYQAGIEGLESEGYDAVVLDLFLPGPDEVGELAGLQLARHHRDALRREEPLIILSAVATEEVTDFLQSHRDVFFFAKPLDPVHLIELLSDL